MSITSIIITSLILFIFYEQVKPMTVMHIDSLERCKCAKDCIMPKFESIVKHYKYITAIDSTFELTEDVKSVKLTSLASTCAVKEALDTCEKGTKKTLGNTCTFLALPGTMWSSFVDSFTPPFKCPFKKGIYVSTNGTLAANLALQMDEKYYRVENDFYSSVTGKYLWTLCLNFQISNVH